VAKEQHTDVARVVEDKRVGRDEAQVEHAMLHLHLELRMERREAATQAGQGESDGAVVS